MSAQSRIPVSSDLSTRFRAIMKSRSIRGLKVSIKNEELVIDDVVEATSDPKSDFEKIQLLLDRSKPCYLLLNISTDEAMSNNVKVSSPADEDSEGNNTKWINVMFVPDSAAVRDKMLYSSSRYSIVNLVGSSSHKSGMFVTDPSELKYSEIEKFIKSSSQEPERETENNEVFVTSEAIGISERRTNISNLEVELSSEAKDALHSLHVGKKRLVLLKLNDKTQEIELDSSFQDPYDNGESDSNSVIEKCFVKDEPRFGYFLYKYESGNNLAVTSLSGIEEHCYQVPVFIYCCPDKSNIKLKMVYSTTKLSVLNIVHSEVGLVEKLRIEVNDPSDLTVNLILTKLNSLKISSTANSNASSSIISSVYNIDENPNINKPSLGKNNKFSKPTPPARRR
ncbi:hypothetical protein BB559_000269 [Furculomyces boomerangus]|uniref:ADF-H domain-containing protein n=2 Tax=Harpellales TaxID=61421 RepID=A0A2T9Z5U5_9FUNG|nr:hypothetical protein BB559_000269 [Furculomyces boomerangus]PVZ99824.1 hypothetical protein BB558_004130 [Smittium angustum]